MKRRRRGENKRRGNRATVFRSTVQDLGLLQSPPGQATNEAFMCSLFHMDSLVFEAAKVDRAIILSPICLSLAASGGTKRFTSLLPFFWPRSLSFFGPRAVSDGGFCELNYSSSILFTFYCSRILFTLYWSRILFTLY